MRIATPGNTCVRPGINAFRRATISPWIITPYSCVPVYLLQRARERERERGRKSVCYIAYITENYRSENLPFCISGKRDVCVHVHTYTRARMSAIFLILLRGRKNRQGMTLRRFHIFKQSEWNRLSPVEAWYPFIFCNYIHTLLPGITFVPSDVASESVRVVIFATRMTMRE
jgi:hypothetical protein